MKLAIIGKEGSFKSALVRHTTKNGFEVSASDITAPIINGKSQVESEVANALKNTDAVLLLLHDEMHLFDEFAAKYLSHIINSMHINKARRLIVSTEINPTSLVSAPDSQSKHDSCLDIMRKSVLDWTVIGYPKHEANHGHRRHDKMAKVLVKEITDATNLRSIVMMPSQSAI